MQATRFIFNQMVSLWANNPLTLSDPDPARIFVHLVKAPFSPRIDLTLAELDLVTSGFVSGNLSIFQGNTGIYADLFTDSLWVRKVNGNANLQIVSSGLTAPVVVYGMILMGAGDSVFWASGLFSRPLPFTADGQGYDLSEFLFNLPSSMMR